MKMYHAVAFLKNKLLIHDVTQGLPTYFCKGPGVKYFNLVTITQLANITQKQPDSKEMNG